MVRILASVFGYANSMLDVFNSNSDAFQYIEKRFDLIAKRFLSGLGMVFFLLKVLFDKSAGEETRKKVAKILMDYHDTVSDDDFASKVSSIIPIAFLKNMR